MENIDISKITLVEIRDLEKRNEASLNQLPDNTFIAVQPEGDSRPTRIDIGVILDDIKRYAGSGSGGSTGGEITGGNVDYEYIESLIALAREAETNAKASEDASKTSEDNALVSETAAAGHADSASASAESAEVSAQKAEESAGSAATEAENAATSAASAKTSETNAKASEANAKTSEINAAASESNAAGSASAAASSASAASTSESNAASSASDAESSASAAESSATNAKHSEDNAKASETAAAASAAAALASEQNAKNSEETVTASASAAKESENNASAHASAAATSEQNAKQSETNALASEEAAKAAAAAAKASEEAFTALIRAGSGEDSAQIGDLSDPTATSGATGSYSLTAGEKTFAQNSSEFAHGQFNVSSTGESDDLKTHYSIGIGTSDTDRKNAEEVMKNGDHYVYGIGGYDGTNTSASSTLQEVVAAKAESSDVTAIQEDITQINASLETKMDVSGVTNIVVLTSAEYTALETKDASTLYFIKG